MPVDRSLSLGLMFWATGTHQAGWRHPDAHVNAAYDMSSIMQVSKIVEEAKFDFIFLGDRLACDPALQYSNPAQISRLEPFTAAAAIAVATERIGIVVTANPTYSDAYDLAANFASLDHLSGGRAAWNLVTGADSAAALNFSREQHWDNKKRYEWAEEMLVIIRALWDGGEKPILYRSTNFSIDGPLGIPRPPQGHVVLLNAGTSDDARDLGARHADVIFAGPQSTLTQRKEYYSDIKRRAAECGRADRVSIVPGLTPIVAPTTEEAVALFDYLNSMILLDPELDPGDEIRAGGIGEGNKRNLTSASKVFGIDLLGNNMADPVPTDLLVQASEEGKRKLREITRLTRRTVDGVNRITYGDLVHATPQQLSHVVVGNPVEVSDEIQYWFEHGMADGFNIYPAYVPGSVSDFTQYVVPELQRRGLFRVDYSGLTLRDHLNLEVPPLERVRDD